MFGYVDRTNPMATCLDMLTVPIQWPPLLKAISACYITCHLPCQVAVWQELSEDQDWSEIKSLLLRIYLGHPEVVVDRPGLLTNHAGCVVVTGAGCTCVILKL
jgi:hypothetical protein